jgi:outer membrane protein
MIKHIALFLLIITPLLVVGQDDNSWSLEKCIGQAEKNSLTIKESQIGVQRATIDVRSNQLSRYPSLNASAGATYNLGRSINPTTNEFVTVNLFANNYGLSSNMTLYNGGRIKNSISKSQVEKQISEADLEQAKRTIALDVASAYLSVLLAIEQEKNAQVTVEQSDQQLDRINKLIRVGSLPEGDKYEVEAQFARDEQSLVSAENSLQQAYLNLKLLLQIPMEQDFEIEEPNISIPQPETFDLQPYESIVKRAIENQPSIRAGELRLQTSDYDIEIAKAGKRPSANVFANTGTNFSSITQLFTGTGYFGQMNENFNGSISLSLSVPIYDREVTKTAVELAKLSQLTQQLSNRRVRQALEADVQRALADARAAAKQYQAAQRTLNASQMAFNNTKKRYELGASTLLDFNTSRNNLAQAEFNLLIAKYDYIFKLKILDFYQGKKITLK